MTNEYKGLFIDDNLDDKNKYSQILNYLPYTTSNLVVEGLSPEQIMDLVNTIQQKSPDIVFLDFRLDEDLDSNNLSVNEAYKGGGIAQLVRERVSKIEGLYQDHPIVLVSSENNLEHLYDPEKTTHDLFDSCYKKEELADDNNHKKISNKIIALIEGYKILNQQSIELDILKLFNIEKNEENDEILTQQELKQPLLSSEIPHVRARFILKNILRREGVLISKYEVAARLGADPESLDEIILSALNNCKYTGIFSEGWERWWSHLFEDFLTDNVGFRPYGMTSKDRIVKLNSKIGSTLKPAISRWNGSENEKAVFACTLCRQPTELKHSLSAYDPSIPKFVQKKRICFRCIKEESYENEKIFIDDNDKKFVMSVMQGNI